MQDLAAFIVYFRPITRGGTIDRSSHRFSGWDQCLWHLQSNSNPNLSTTYFKHNIEVKKYVLLGPLFWASPYISYGQCTLLIEQGSASPSGGTAAVCGMVCWCQCLCWPGAHFRGCHWRKCKTSSPRLLILMCVLHRAHNLEAWWHWGLENWPHRFIHWCYWCYRKRISHVIEACF